MEIIQVRKHEIPTITHENNNQKHQIGTQKYEINTLKHQICVTKL
jgi:archaellum component FlaC